MGFIFGAFWSSAKTGFFVCNKTYRYPLISLCQIEKVDLFFGSFRASGFAHVAGKEPHRSMG